MCCDLFKVLPPVSSYLGDLSKYLKSYFGQYFAIFQYLSVEQKVRGSDFVQFCQRLNLDA